jgi:hypothetical protein
MLEGKQPLSLLRFFFAAPDSLILAVRSSWTVMSSAAGMYMTASCTVRPDGPAF